MTTLLTLSFNSPYIGYMTLVQG